MGLGKSKIAQLLAERRRGYALAQDFYTDSGIYTAEIENIFSRHWLYAGHISELSEIGSYFLCEFDVESIIVTRTTSGDIKAFANVCRHRGSRICLDAKGTRKLFICPYHAWSYDLDGQLVSAGQMPGDFEAEDYGLHTVHIANIEGLIFICLAETPLSLAPLKQDLRHVFDTLELNKLKLAATKSYAIEANWKLAVENYQECYHCAPAHKDFAKIHAMARPREDFLRRKETFEAARQDQDLTQDFNAYFGQAALGTEGYQYGRNPLMDGCVSGSRDGRAVAPLLGKLETYSGGASEFMIGPLMYFLIYDDHMVGYRFLPTGHNTCKCDVYWYVRGDAKPGRDYDVETLTWLWDVTTQADQEIISNNQKGVTSRYYSPGRLSEMEDFLESFLSWYAERLAA